MKSVIIIVVASISLTISHKLPDNFKKCKINDSNLDNCLKTSIQNAVQLIGASGITSINLPSIDPVEVTYVEIGAGTTAVQLVQKYSNVKLFGISKGTVEKAHLDFDNKVLTFTILVPQLIQKAKYEVDGKILFLPVFGKGDSELNFKNARLTHNISFKEETKGGKLYFKIKSYQLQFTIEGAVYQFDNLFNGDKLLADNILKVMNDNWKPVFDDVREGVEKSWQEVFKSLALRLFDNVPVGEIFLQ